MKIKGKCSRCDKWLVLVHKLKTNPDGRLPRHKDNFGRSCWGWVVDKKEVK